MSCLKIHPAEARCELGAPIIFWFEGKEPLTGVLLSSWAGGGGEGGGREPK